MIRLPAPAILAVCLCAAVAPSQWSVPFERFAADFLRRHEATRADDLGELLDSKYLHLRVGILDLYYPPGELAKKGRAEGLEAVLVGLVRLQVEWVSWVDPGGPAPDGAAALLRVLAGVKPRALARLEGGGDLFERAGVAADGVSAAESFARAMGTAAFFGEARAEPVPAQRIVLSPDRRHFLELCSYLGSVDEQNEAIFWQPSTPARAEFWCPFPIEMQVIAMEYASPEQKGDDFTTGFSMNAREKTGLQQHVAQRAAASVTHAYLAPGVAAPFEGGLIQNLVIALYGENNARSGGDGKARSAGGTAGFVAGGRSEGGGFVPMNMDSDWRAMKGAGYFVRELRRGQRGGSRRGAGGGHAFLLRARDGNETHLATAPFLGPTEPPAPAEFADDLAEMLRAYRSGFAHWLRTAAGGTGRRSAARFAELLCASAGPDEVDFAALCRRVYGVPLTGHAGDGDHLEARFLAWLRKR